MAGKLQTSNKSIRMKFLLYFLVLPNSPHTFCNRTDCLSSQSWNPYWWTAFLLDFNFKTLPTKLNWNQQQSENTKIWSQINVEKTTNFIFYISDFYSISSNVSLTRIWDIKIAWQKWRYVINCEHAVLDLFFNVFQLQHFYLEFVQNCVIWLINCCLVLQNGDFLLLLLLFLETFDWSVTVKPQQRSPRSNLGMKDLQEIHIIKRKLTRFCLFYLKYGLRSSLLTISLVLAIHLSRVSANRHRELVLLVLDGVDVVLHLNVS